LPVLPADTALENDAEQGDTTVTRTLALTAFMLFIQATAQAESVLEDVLVTGTYSPVPAITSTVTVLESDHIRALNKRNVADLLKGVPGLLVEQQGGPGGLTAISIRGAEANFTVVLLDGVPLNDPTNSRGGGYDFSNLNSARIERIEIVRGAQSALYGSDALAGVINIVTRRPTGGHQQQLSIEGGDDNYSDVRVSAQGTIGTVEYVAELAQRDDGEPVDGSSRESDSVHFRLGWQPDDRHRIKASYRYLDGERASFPEQSGGSKYATSRELEESDYEDALFFVAWEAQFSELWRSEVSADYLDHSEDYGSPGIAPYFEVPPNAAETDFERKQLRWVNTLHYSDALQLGAGVDYRDEQGESVGFLDFSGFLLATDFELDRATTGWFATVTALPIGELLLQGSARYDDPDEFDSETSLSLGARYQLLETVEVSANWGESFKLPSFFALGHALVGNPELQPELAESWDVSLAWQATHKVRLEATYFDNSYQDLIDFDDEAFINVNRKNIDTDGVETQFQWGLSEAFSLGGQATYTNIDVKGEDTVLTGRPEWTGGLIARWQITPQWSSSLDYRYTGEQWAVSRHSSIAVAEELDDFHRVDWVLGWQVNSSVQVLVSVDNLMDEDYQTAVGFPAPGRGARLQLRLHNQ
jgi:vitamin B12 transporter